MRTLISGPAFAKAVSHVSKALVAGERQAIRLAATADGLRLDGDGLYYSRADLDAQTIEDGVAVVNGFWLATASAVMPAEELNVETTDGRLRLDCRGIVMELPLLDDPSVEPNVPDMPADWTALPDGGFARAVAAVWHAAGRGADSPVLQAVRVRGDADGVQLTATNRFVAASARVDAMSDMDALVPAQWLKANAEDADRIGATERLFVVAGPTYTDATALVDGTAPDLARRWPSRHAALVLTMDRAELLAAARRAKAAKFSDGETVALSFVVGDGEVVIGLTDSESGSGARQAVAAQVEGEVSDRHAVGASGMLRLDARYVVNACAALYGERVSMFVSVRPNGRYQPTLLVDAPSENRSEGFDMRDEQLIVPIV